MMKDDDKSWAIIMNEMNRRITTMTYLREGAVFFSTWTAAKS